MRVTPDELTLLAQLVRDLCGITLDATKGYLIESRLSSLADACGCRSFHDFWQLARSSSDQGLRNQIIDSITTQETLFFRDNSPFEVLQYKVIPDLIDAKAATPFPRRFRIWSAACSTGQEPYSLAMTLGEMLPNLPSWNINILATDISDGAIAQASRGLYPEHAIQRGMKPAMLAKYFTRQTHGWKVKDELRAYVSYAKRSLLSPFTELGPFDIIFCRNVAIYFDEPTRRSLFQRLADRLVPGGYLFVGSAESLADLGPRFTPRHHCRATYYQPNGTLPAQHAPPSTQPASRLATPVAAR